MITIHLYKYKGLPNVVDKNSALTSILETTGQFNGVYDEHDPSIRVESTLNLEDANYCAIIGDSMTLYYFIDSKTVFRQNVFDLKLRLDVLNTYKTDIKTMSGHIVRGTNQQPYVKDDADSVACYQTYEKFDIGDPFKDYEQAGSYILVASQDFYSNIPQ